MCERQNAVKVYYGNNATVHECNDRFSIYDVSGDQENLIAEGLFNKKSLSTICVKAHVKYGQKEKRTKRSPFEATGSHAERNNINVDRSYKTESQKELYKHLQLDHSEIYERGHLIPCRVQLTNSSRDATCIYHNVVPVRKITNAMMSLLEEYVESVLKSDSVGKNSVPSELVLIVCAQGQVHCFSKLNNNFVPLYLGPDLRTKCNQIPVPEIIVMTMIDLKKKKGLAFLIANSPTALDNLKERAYNINFEAEKWPRMKKELKEKIDNHEILAFHAYDVPDLFPGAPFNQFVSDELKKYNIRRLEQSSLKNLSGPNTASQYGKKKHYLVMAWESTIEKQCDVMCNAQILSILNCTLDFCK